MLDQAQTAVARYAYDSFGNTAGFVGTLLQPYRYSTKPYDENTGLFDYGYRFYSPSMARWLSRDPAEEDEAVNLYAFVGNSPVNFVDPVGLQGVPSFPLPAPPGPGPGQCPIEKKPEKEPCPPCTLQPPEPRCDYDHPHYPCPGAHCHTFVVNQNPKTCDCFVNLGPVICIDGGSPVPAPVPLPNPNPRPMPMPIPGFPRIPAPGIPVFH
ncbi:MAG: RHS repeat-associated core domain-containing protein [Verrucomicrobia bacterium]|nr:RHS repeat-associated core domain-containing protein [Verrucomicrobiota bacterium]